ncbi:acetyl-CoA carboxylase biotin carboxyl carrier protein [Ralstonia wenshanensis]|uniref:Biotin carboxyl carrier protein of acetyl-CoA carboxylase n=1 Tax=Ralstonia wenshanensis TaxID=2842456 RepID=A0AAD2APK3_9RALS|nr:acetyl-CoA carboxylase biotin carboxyl carrier protein subunit [Ralstonia wenshanensis]CAJ0686157.1 Biotin carboxyl carrier protein of acetyl-CoA carboxylase [Ralstonia wenshanensis]
MDLSQIKQLMDAMASSDLAEMSFSYQGWVLRLVRQPSAGHCGAAATSSAAMPEDAPALPPPAQPQPVTAAAQQRELAAPMFGVVHLQPAPGEPVFVQPGQTVQAGQTVCTIEAMKVFNAVVAESDGIVDAALVESGVEVEAGQPLFRFA